MENFNLNEKKTTDTSTELTEMSELSNKNFKATIHKTNQQVIMSTTETNEKTESQQRNKRYKVQPSGNFRTEKIQ